MACNLLFASDLNRFHCYYKIQKDGGVPRSTVGKLISMKFKTVQLDTLYQITSTMGVSIREFFDDPVFDDVSD